MRKLKKEEWIAVVAAVVFVSYSMFGGYIMNLFKGASAQDNQANVMNSQNQNPASNSVVVNDVVVGTGREANTGDTVTAHYILKLSDGTLVQDSHTIGQPITFVLGAGQVIPGWETGIVGMKVGGTRTIVIPPQFGYGSEQVGPIPANSTLVFTVELVDATGTPAQ